MINFTIKDYVMEKASNFFDNEEKINKSIDTFYKLAELIALIYEEQTFHSLSHWNSFVYYQTLKLF